MFYPLYLEHTGIYRDIQDGPDVDRIKIKLNSSKPIFGLSSLNGNLNVSWIYFYSKVPRPVLEYTPAKPNSEPNVIKPEQFKMNIFWMNKKTMKCTVRYCISRYFRIEKLKVHGHVERWQCKMIKLMLMTETGHSLCWWQVSTTIGHQFPQKVASIMSFRDRSLSMTVRN